MANEILGISGHLDISDIVRSIDELYSEVSKLESVSKETAAKVQKAYQDVANASEKEISQKASTALKVFTKAFEEAQAKADGEVTKIERTITRLQTKLQELSVQRSETVTGTKTYDNITRQIESLNTQIHNQQNFLAQAKNNALQAGENYNVFLSHVTTANSAIDAFNAVSTSATALTGANAVAHTAAGVAVGVEAAQHIKNTDAISKENTAINENNSSTAVLTESAQSFLQLAQQEAAQIDAVTQKIRENTATTEEIANTQEFAKERVVALREEYERLTAKYEEAQQKYSNSFATVSYSEDGTPHVNTEEFEKTAESLNRAKEQLNQMNSAVSTYAEALRRLEEAQRSTTAEEEKGSQQKTDEKDKIRALSEELKQWEERLKEARTDATTNVTLPSWMVDFGNFLGVISKSDWQNFDEARNKVKELREALANLQQPTTSDVGTVANVESVNKRLDEQKKIIIEANAVIQAYEGELNKLAEKGNLTDKQQEEFRRLKTAIDEAKQSITEANAEINNIRGETFAGRILNGTEKVSSKIRGTIDSIANGAKNTISDVGGKIDSWCSQHISFYDTAKDKANELGNGMSSFGQRMASETRVATDAVKNFGDKIGNVLTGNGKFQESLGQMKNAFGGLGAPISAAVGGVMAMTKALWSMAATPIGAVIAAIVIGLQALHTWLTKDAEGQKAMAQISAFLGSLLSSLTDIVVKLGKYIFHAFADAQGPMNAFGKGLVTTIKSAVSSVAKLLQGLGNTIKGIFTLDWDSFSSGLSQIWSGVKNAGTAVLSAFETQWHGITGAIKMAGDAWNTMSENNFDLANSLSDVVKKAEQAAKFAGQELDAQRELGQAKEYQAEKEAEIAREKEKIYTLTGKEKDEQIKMVKEMEKEKYDRIISAQQKLYDIQKGRNELHTKSIEAIGKERDLHIQVLNTQAQQAASTRMLTRMEMANIRKMDSAANSASKAAASAAKKEARQNEQVREAQARFDEVVRKNSLARATAEVDLENAITDARIAAMRDGEEKVIAEKRRQLQKEIEEIENKKKAAVEAERERQRAEFEAQEKLVKAHGGQAQSWNDSMLDSDEIEKITKQYDALTGLKKQAYVNEQLQQERQALLDYIKEYGSIQDQRAAITKEYDEKIAQESSAAQKAMLAKQREDILKELDMKELQSEVDWENVFDNLSSQSTEALKDLKNKLRNALNTKDIDPENAKVLADKIREIEETLADRNIFTAILSGLRERKKAAIEAAEAEQEYQAAVKKSNDEQMKLLLAQDDARRRIKSATGKDVTVGQLTTMKRDELMKLIGLEQLDEQSVENADKIRIVNEVLDRLTISTTNASAAQEQLTQAQKNATNRQKALDNFTKGGDFKKFIGDLFGHNLGFTEITSLIDTNVQSLSELTDTLGLGGTEFGEAVHNFAGGVGSFNNAIQALASGDVVGAVNHVISGFQSIGKVFGIGGGNAAEINKQLERLSDRNEILTKSIDRLAELMGDSAGDSAIRQYEKMMELQKELEANLLKQMQLQMSYHNSHGSFNSYWGGFTQEELDQFNSRNGTDWSGDLNDLNADLAAMLEADANLWQKIKDTGKGGYGERVADWISQLAEQSGKAAQYTEQINNNLTNTSFDSLKSSFLDTLMDMEADSKAFADNLTTIMTEALVNRFVLGDEFDDWLKKWHERYAELMRDTSLTDEQRQEALAGLRTEYQLMGEELKGDAKAIQDATGYTELMAQKANEAKEAFGDLGTTFRNTLLDINATAEDFAKELSQTLIENLVDRFILNDAFNEWLEDWTNRYNEILNDGNLSQEEADARLTAMLDEALQKRGELVGQAEELRERLKALQQETEKDTTFSGLTGSWVNALMDMNKTAEDWAQDVGKMMAQKIMEEMVAVRVMQPILDQLQEAFNGYDMATADMMDIVEDETIQGLLGKMKDMFPELQWLAENLLQSFGVTVEKEADKTFSGMTSSWVSALMDMNKTAEDWSQDIGRTMAQKIIEEMVVAARLQPLLDELQAAFDNVIAQEGATIDDILGDRGINAALDAISTAFPELQELTRGIMERMGVIIGEENPFSGMRDSFVSSLMDMNADAESFGKEIGKTLIQQMIEQVLTKRGFQNQLDALGEQWQEALERGDTAAIERIRQELMRLREQAGQAVQPLLDDLAELEKQTVASPFDNLRSSLLSALMDMKSDTRSFANDINNILTQAFIDKFVLGEAFDRQLEAWKKQYAAIMGDADLSDEERAYQLQMLKNMITEYSEQMKGEAQAIHDLMGTGQFAEDQSATMNMSDKATYEQMDQYLGTQMGIYIATEQGNLVRQQILQTLQSMGGITSPNGEAVSEINAKLSYTNDYLFDIKRSNNAILSLLSSRLATIEGRLGRVL